MILLGIEQILPLFKKKSAQYSGLSVTQSLYTPLNLYTSDASYGERPYSANGMVTSLSSYFWERSSFSLELAVGEIGSNAQGKYSQSTIHKITNSTLPQGWDRQIPHQKLYQMNLDHKYFWNPYIGLQTSIKLGNLDTSANVGPIFRIGSIHSAVIQGLNMSDPTPAYPTDETEYYFYFRPSLKIQSTNGTLGGVNKNQYAVPINQNGGQTYIFNDGRTVFFGEPLYNAILNERSGNAVLRFGVYEQLVPADTPFSLNFLIFNTIFNGAPVPNDGLKLAILQGLLNPNLDLAKYPGIEYFVYDTLFRDSLTGASSFSKLLAIRYFNSLTEPSGESLLLTTLLFYNETQTNRTYNVPLKRFQGKLSTGFVYQAPKWFFQFGLEIASLEYNAEPELLPFHRYTSVQLGVKF